jgi:hypothetical protein
VQSKDLERWTDPRTNQSFGPVQNSSPVKLILGIEADTHEDSTSFWRMGYNYPVQLTQWALASTANNAVLNRFLHNFKTQIKEITQKEHANATSIINTLQRLDPIELTGPAAITAATKQYLEETEGLRWQAMSGLDDGGRSKVVSDTLILPITGFRYVTNIRTSSLWCMRANQHLYTVQDEAATQTWARNLSLTRTLASDITPRDRGRKWI